MIRWVRFWIDGMRFLMYPMICWILSVRCLSLGVINSFCILFYNRLIGKLALLDRLLLRPDIDNYGTIVERGLVGHVIERPPGIIMAERGPVIVRPLGRNGDSPGIEGDICSLGRLGKPEPRNAADGVGAPVPALVDVTVPAISDMALGQAPGFTSPKTMWP